MESWPERRQELAKAIDVRLICLQPTPAGAGDVPEINSDELSIIDELYQGGFARLIGGELRG